MRKLSCHTMVFHLFILLMTYVLYTSQDRFTTPIKGFDFLNTKKLQLNRFISYKNQVVSNTSIIPQAHPTLRLIVERLKNSSLPGQRHETDKEKIALCIEGGGMRGAVSAGATAALNFLGLHDTIDEVFGSSAGAMIGAYFISRQYNGTEIYHDILPSAQTKFINKGNLLKAIGIPVREVRSLMPKSALKYLKKLNNQETENHHVLNLDYLLDGVMNDIYNLDWKTFQYNEQFQKLNIISSCVNNMTSIVLNRENQNYDNLEGLLACIRASMLVPGIAGDLLYISNENKVPSKLINKQPIKKTTSFIDPIKFSFANKSISMLPSTYVNRMKSLSNPLFTLATKPNKTSLYSSGMQKFQSFKNTSYHGIKNFLNRKSFMNTNHNNHHEIDNHELHQEVRLCDAFICEPMPYRSAIRSGANHILMLRTRPDSANVIEEGKPGLYEKYIASRFFANFGELIAMRWVLEGQHAKIYAEDIKLLNEASLGPKEGVLFENQLVHMVPIAPQNATEMSQLETKRKSIYLGMRDGAQRVLEIFLPIIQELHQHHNNISLHLSQQHASHLFLNLTIDEALDLIFPLSRIAQIKESPSEDNRLKSVEKGKYLPII